MLCGYKVNVLPLTLRTSGSLWLQTHPQACHVVRGQWVSSSIASHPVIRRVMTSSTQTVRNVVTISTPAPHSLLGWRRDQFSHLPAQAIIQRSLGTEPVTVLCRASWVWLLAVELVLEVSSQQFFQSDHTLAPWQGFKLSGA